MNNNLRFLSLFVILFLSLLSPAKSQLKDIKLSDEDVQQLKSKTVIFVLPKTAYPYVDDYNQMLSKVWTMTPLKVIRYEDINHYYETADQYAFFLIDGFQFHSATHYYLTLCMPEISKGKMRFKDDLLCRVMLYPDVMTVSRFRTGKGGEALYKEAVFRNFTLPYMMVYLNFVQENIANRINPTVIRGYRDNTLARKLSKDTLYVPKNILYGHSMFGGPETLADKGVFSKYPYPYKFVSEDELVDLVEADDTSRPIYLLEYILSGSDKYVGVLEVRSGKVLYRTSSPVSTNFKEKDLERILQQGE
ncbi:hypothetical protein [Chitinophaga sp.]|uniref:hypothetical protein n=1 Tax=Chitinophaga sp. TaxID=1869181 RepID=UPI0031D40963